MLSCWPYNKHVYTGQCRSMKADLVNSPPVFLVVPQHAIPQHVHHLRKLLIHEGGSDYKNNHTGKKDEKDKHLGFNEDTLQLATVPVTSLTRWHRYPKTTFGCAVSGTEFSQISGITGSLSTSICLTIGFKEQ